MKHLVILLAVVTFASCSKYEEGPAISLKTKKARITNTWKIEAAYRDGKLVTDEYDEYQLQMLDDGDATLAVIYASDDFFFEASTDGTWEFNDSKEKLILDFEYDGADNEYQILRLKSKELWLREVGGEDELHLIPIEE